LRIVRAEAGVFGDARHKATEMSGQPERMSL